MPVQTIIKCRDIAIAQIAIIEEKKESAAANATTYIARAKFTRARYGNEDKLIS